MFSFDEGRVRALSQYHMLNLDMSDGSCPSGLTLKTTDNLQSSYYESCVTTSVSTIHHSGKLSRSPVDIDIDRQVSYK